MIEYLSLQRINQRYITETLQAINNVVNSGWYLQGKAVQTFEKQYAQYIGTPYCISCGNGLDALTLILKSYIELGKMQPGDEIIVPANTYIATILSITANQLIPVLVEPRIDTLQIDDRLIENAITLRTRAIILVHLYGRCAYTEHIGKLCQKYNLQLVEDNAQAHGCFYHNTQRTGALGDAAAHSFYPSKNLGALGDAGAVTTCHADLAKAIRALGNYGSSRKYVFTYKGKNSRMDELQAAVLSVKLKYLDTDNAYRQRLAQYYLTHLYNPLITLPKTSTTNNVWHIFPILTPQREALQTYLQAHGIQTAIHYPIPPHQQEAYKEWKHCSYPITERIHQQELSIPLNPIISIEEAKYIVEVLNRSYQEVMKVKRS